MKIVQVNTVCGTGSTGKIVVALHNLANKNKIDSYIAYGRNTAPSQIPNYKIGNKCDFYSHVLINFFKGKSGFGSKSVTLKFLNWLDSIKPDIIHLHNIHNYLQNMFDIFHF